MGFSTETYVLVSYWAITLNDTLDMQSNYVSYRVFWLSNPRSVLTIQGPVWTAFKES